MRRPVDPISLAAGVTVAVMGALLLLAQESAFDLTLGLFGAIVSAVIGTILLVGGLGDGDREP